VAGADGGLQMFLFGNFYDAPLNAADFIGFALFAIGWLIEVIADAQKFSFKRSNKRSLARSPVCLLIRFFFFRRFLQCRSVEYLPPSQV
jgi:hypothetical protein